MILSRYCMVALLSLVFAAGSSADQPPEEVRAEFQRIAKRIKNSANPYLGHKQVDDLRMKLGDPRINPIERAQLLTQLCAHLLRVGDVDEAVRVIDSAMQILDQFPQFNGNYPPPLHRARGLAYLRKAEVYNCVQRNNPDCCLFPLKDGGVHKVDGPARQAKQSYLEFLRHHPDDLSAAWLLNLVCMALNEHPNGVPSMYRIPAEAFKSEYEIKPFVDIAPKLGVNTFNLCGGSITEDFDNDGFIDVMTSTYDPSGPLHLYRNNGDGTMKDISASSHCNSQLGGLNAVATDYNNDGFTDVLILRGAWLADAGKIRNSLLRNNGDNTFTDVTREAGLVDPPSPTQAAVWADFNNDGWLDLFIGNESRLETDNAGNYPSQLLMNNGDGTFSDETLNAGVLNQRYAKGVTAGDYDNDGDMDIYVSNVGNNRLYRNEGDGTFVDAAEPLGLTEPSGRSFACWFFDYDNDGNLDLFVSAYRTSMADLAADYLGRPHEAISPRLYRNEGDRFVDVTKEMNLDNPYLPMGANFGDIDNDGFLDIYLATGEPSFQILMPNVMLRNNGGKGFQNVTTSGRVGHLQKGHGVAFADLDNDGDQDIYHQLGGFYPGDKFHNVLFQNPGYGNKFLHIELVGKASNRRGVGVRIQVTVEQERDGKTVSQEFHRAVGSVSSFGGSPARQEIGLGPATKIKQVRVFWPATNITQIFKDVPLNSAIRVTEGTDQLENVALKKIDW